MFYPISFPFISYTQSVTFYGTFLDGDEHEIQMEVFEVRVATVFVTIHILTENSFRKKFHHKTLVLLLFALSSSLLVECRPWRCFISLNFGSQFVLDALRFREASISKGKLWVLFLFLSVEFEGSE